MYLKTKVFVLDVTNLSDARYCAGMGVDTIAFTLEGEKAISKEEILAISQWLSGVNIGLSVTNLNPEIQSFLLENDFQTIISSNKDVLTQFSDKTKIYTGENNDFTDYNYFFSTSATDKAHQIVEISSPDELNNILTNPLIDGIVLRGGEEERPGYKTFDELAEILEALETI